MEPCEEARQLLLGAEKDLRALAGMREPEVFAEEIFGFHAQQAVEKCLKAWITLFGAEYPRTHDLSFLLSRLESLGERVEEFEDPCEAAVNCRISTSTPEPAASAAAWSNDLVTASSR